MRGIAIQLLFVTGFLTCITYQLRNINDAINVNTAVCQEARE